MTRWMLDTSALAQRAHPDVDRRLRAALEDGAAVCDMVVAESLIRARSLADYEARHRLFEVVEVKSVDDSVWNHVFGLAGVLAEAGETVASGDAVIAACATVNELSVLHYDTDYETLGRLELVDHEWVVSQGTL